MGPPGRRLGFDLKFAEVARKSRELPLRVQRRRLRRPSSARPQDVSGVVNTHAWRTNQATQSRKTGRNSPKERGFSQQELQLTYRFRSRAHQDI